MRVILFGLLGILLVAPLHSVRDKATVQPAPATLTDAQLAGLVGSGACKDCRYAGARQDECYHALWVDPCQTSKCIANYALEDTCDPGVGTCTAIQNPDKAWVTQYSRVDSGCTTSNPTGWTNWYTHYYGADCTAVTPRIRCQKTNGACNGTLIDSSTRYPGIMCQ